MAISAAEKQVAYRPRVETAEPHAYRPARCGEWLPAEMFGAIRSSKRPAFVVQAMLHRPNETMARRESWLRRDVHRSRRKRPTRLHERSCSNSPELAAESGRSGRARTCAYRCFRSTSAGFDK